jgi:predicted metal-dependent TIM-barrel fold hydrolase
MAHPLSVSVGAPHDAVTEIVGLGAYAEFCWPTVSPGRRSPAEVVGLIRAIGAERTILTSDYFGGAGPSPSDLLRMLAGVLYDNGLGLEEIRTAAVTNPARLLGLDD